MLRPVHGTELHGVAAKQGGLQQRTAVELRHLGVAPDADLAECLHVTEEGIHAQIQGAFYCVAEERRSAAEMRADRRTAARTSG